ncbi:MAG: tetratricopeptide repeat protein [Bacteroidota bacterium]
MDLESELKRGIALHDAGQLGDAARCYQAILDQDPGNVDALNLMSALANLAGEAAFAADLARQAIAGDDSYFAPYLALGNALQNLGDIDGAVEAFRHAIRLNDASAESYCNLASALNACNRFDEAVDAAVQALVLKPDFPEAHNNFGNALLGQGNTEDAVECYEKSLALNPDFAEAWQNLGNAHLRAGDAEAALGAFARALQLEETAERFHNLGNAFLALAQFEPAARCFAQAIESDPGLHDAWMNLSVALKGLGQLADAEAVQRDAVQLRPEDAEAHFNLAVLLLQQGKYAEGWAEYEWRWQLPEFQQLLRDFPQPRWDGGRFDGRTLLVTAEQGYGDALEFCRFVPLVAALGGRVVLECRPGLERLLQTLAEGVEVVALGAPLPDFDLHAPLMSLPGLLGVTLENLPAAVPYLAVPAGSRGFPALAEPAKLKVGLAWAGKATRQDNAFRSCTLDDLAPLLDEAGAEFFSLQVGPAGGLGRWQGRGNLHDLAPDLSDFVDTAAAIAQMDLVITVDTSVAHLAGALAKPVWVLLSRPSNGFLWMDGRSDSPWYPSVRLFRQTVPGDWVGTLSEVKAELARLVRCPLWVSNPC